MTYAAIQNNTIVNLIIWDGVTPYNPGDGIALVPTSSLPQGADIGWTLTAGTWTAPTTSPIN